MCPCLSLPLYNCFLSIPKLWEVYCTPHSEDIPFLLEKLSHEPASCLDEINGKLTPKFSNCRINLQAQCNRDSREFKATLTSVAVLTSAIDLKCVSEDEIFFFFFLLLSFFKMNAIGSFSVTRFSPSGGKRFICFERILLRSNLVPQRVRLVKKVFQLL